MLCTSHLSCFHSCYSPSPARCWAEWRVALPSLASLTLPLDKISGGPGLLLRGCVLGVHGAVPDAVPDVSRCERRDLALAISLSGTF